MIPANRLGNAGGLNVAQLKIMQEVITLCVFTPFSPVLHRGEMEDGLPVGFFMRAGGRFLCQ